jgi:cyclophilin family peptidyl-prolyl cis-trans isomerase
VNRLALLGCVFLIGCGSSGEETLLRDIKKMNEDAAAAVGKAEDLDGLKDAMTLRAKRNKEIVAGAQKLSREQKENLKKKLDEGAELGQEALDKALSAFHEKLKEGPHPTVLMQTSMGDVKIELYEKLAPVTVQNFLGYVDDKHYDGTVFHRVIPSFMIQGGGFEPGAVAKNAEKRTGPPIANESYNGLANKRGTIAMARTDDPHSATAQFYVNVKDNAMLDRVNDPKGYGYAAFGKVIEGMDVVDKIRNVKTTRVGGHDDVPVQDVVIKSVRRVEK